jgi:hypothetical protein
MFFCRLSAPSPPHASSPKGLSEEELILDEVNNPWHPRDLESQ